MSEEINGVEEAETPLIEGEEKGERLGGPKVALWRRLVFLVILGSYPPILGVLGMRMAEASEETMLPSSLLGLLGMTVSNLVIFGLFFGVAWLFFPLRPKDLFFRWSGKVWPLVLGMVYSVALRMGVAGLVLGAFLFASLSGYFGSGESSQERQEEVVQQLRPDISHIVDVEAMVENPWLLVFYVTVISFILAGFREELWRAGMIAGMEGLGGDQLPVHGKRILIVLTIAVIFGIGHLPQGIGGVLLTGALGIGLGLILIYHRSIWIATLAHGFFDATTFILLYAVYRLAPDWLKGILG